MLETQNLLKQEWTLFRVVGQVMVQIVSIATSFPRHPIDSNGVDKSSASWINFFWRSDSCG